MRATASASPASVTPFSQPTTPGGPEGAGVCTSARGTPSPLTVAVMQPYFIPYAGYFRLFAASDLFVIYDCVQFQREGWVHRNRLTDPFGANRWLTLPLEKSPLATPIRDLRFVPDAKEVLGRRLQTFP